MNYEDLEDFNRQKAAAAVLASLIGLSTGFAAAQSFQPDQDASYCERIESQVMEERNFSGNLACFSPDLVQVNLSEEVENNSELRCVCRQEYRGAEQIIPISFSN
jgi:hypothetical protein